MLGVEKTGKVSEWLHCGKGWGCGNVFGCWRGFRKKGIGKAEEVDKGDGGVSESLENTALREHSKVLSSRVPWLSC